MSQTVDNNRGRWYNSATMTSVYAALLALAAFSHAASGGQAGDFLTQETGARGAALGGAMTALTDDTMSLQWNPAGLASLTKPEISASHITLFEDTAYDFVAAGMNTRKLGGFAAAFVRQGSSGFERRNSPNDAPTGFSIVDSAYLFGWGFSLPKGVDVGVTFKSVKEKIDTTSAGGNGADLGAVLRPLKGLRLGLRMANALAPKLRFVSEPVAYARALEASPAYTFAGGKGWTTTLALKLAKADGQSLAASGGAELAYGALAALRLGMSDKGLATGAGLTLGNSRFDYAALLHELGVSHMVTFVQRFGHTSEEREARIRQGISELSRAEGVRLARVYLAKADEELRTERTQDALRDLEAASLLDPADEGIREKIRSVSERWDHSLRRQMTERTATLARQQQAQGNLLAARQYWQSALELDPGSNEAVASIEEIDRTLSKEQRAKLDELRLAQSVNEQQQLLMVATSHLAQDRYRQARLDAEKAAARFPQAPEFPGFLLRVRRQVEEFVTLKLAEADRTAAAGNVAESVRIVESALREDPGNSRLTERALALRAQLQRAATPESRKQLEQMYYRAVEAYLKGDLATSGELAKEVYRLDPTFEGARTLRDKIEAAQRFSK